MSEMNDNAESLELESLIELIPIEDVDDIIDDLDQALAAIPERELSDLWETRFRV